MKRIIGFLLALLMILTPLSIGVFANDRIEENIEPEYEPVCGTYPSHRMVASGFGTVVKLDKSVYLLNRCAWQCSRCMLVMVTDGDLYPEGMAVIGKYATWHGTNEPINKNGCYIRGADHYGYTSNNYLPGYKFYLAS